MNRFSRRNRAFTLTEILVVIGIVAVLSALLFPVFNIVREKGRASSCTSNLHQISLAFQQYSADNNVFPLWYNEHKPTNPLPSPYPGLPWVVRIQPYLKSNAVFQCPSDNQAANPNPMFPGSIDTSGYTDYSYNTNLSGSSDAKVIHASEMVLVFDCGSTAGYNTQTSASYPGNGGGDRHSGGANYAFVDGHIKWFRVEEAALTAQFFYLDLTTGRT